MLFDPGVTPMLPDEYCGGLPHGKGSHHQLLLIEFMHIFFSLKQEAAAEIRAYFSTLSVTAQLA